MMLTVDPPQIAALRTLLERLEYDAVQRNLRSDYFTSPFPAASSLERVLETLPPLQQTSFRCLFLGQPVAREELDDRWGTPLTEGLLRLGLLELAGPNGVRTADLSVVSFLSRYFVVSMSPYYPQARNSDSPVYIGPDSLTLAAALPYRGTFGRVLDLCTGSGIQAILLADIADQVTAVELNPLAARAAQFNAVLNGVADRLAIVQGNLYDAVPDGRYDLIVANPPFLPVPDGAYHPVCGNGGEDGLAVIAPLLDGMPPWLSDDGQAIVYGEGVGDDKGPFVRELLASLASEMEIEVKLIVLSRSSVRVALYLKAMSLAQLPRLAAGGLRPWKQLYERLGASHTYTYLIKMRRGDSGAALSMLTAINPDREVRLQEAVDAQ
jgi:methylase of polypeptide subunit release factors